MLQFFGMAGVSVMTVVSNQWILWRRLVHSHDRKHTPSKIDILWESSWWQPVEEIEGLLFTCITLGNKYEGNSSYLHKIGMSTKSHGKCPQESNGKLATRWHWIKATAGGGVKIPISIPSYVCTFASIAQLLDHLSKICIILFGLSVQRCQKYVNIWKLTSGDRAENQDI